MAAPPPQQGITAAARIQAAAQRQRESQAAQQDASAKKTTASLSGEFESAIQRVEVDAMVLMKISKHAARPQPNAIACGQLLGLDSQGTLHISDSFNLPNNHIIPPIDQLDAEQSFNSRDAHRRGKDSDAFDVAAANGAAYTAQLLPRLAECNADANVVGFYCVSGNAGQYAGLNGALIEALARYQMGTNTEAAAAASATAITSKVSRRLAQDKRAPGKGVALVFDSSSTTAESISLKAYRLTDAYINVHRQGKFDSAALAENGILPTNILHEYPVTVTRSSLLSAFLATAQADQRVAVPTFESLSLPSTAPANTPSAAGLAQPLQSLLLSFDTSVQALANTRFKDNRRQDNRHQRSAEGYSDVLKQLASAEGSADGLSEASSLQIARLYAAKAALVV